MKAENPLSVNADGRSHRWTMSQTRKRTALFGVALSLWACVCFLLGSDARVAWAQNGTPGTPWSGAAGITETVIQIMQRQQILDVQPRTSQSQTVLPSYPGNRNKQPRPGSNPAPQSPAPDSSPDAAPLSPQTLGVSWTGGTLAGVNPTNTFPPDTMGAAGPTQFIMALNHRIVSFTKSTGVADGVLNADTDTFFNSVRNGSTTSVPRVRYDRLSGRWFITMMNTSTPNRILIAVSNGSTISSASDFTFFFIPIDTTPPAISSNCKIDYPTLGIDVNALYIGTNNICPQPPFGPGFDSTDGYVVRKSSVLGAGPIVATVFRGLVPSSSAEGAFAPQGVDNYDPAATEGYFIGVSNAFFSVLDLYRITNPGGTPSRSAVILIGVNVTQYPLTVPHKGNSGGAAGELEALDDRLFAAHIRNGRLWTAHNIGIDNTGSANGTLTRDGVRWYELQGIASPGTPSVRQSGTVFAESATNTTDQRNYWMPSIMVSGQGHAALGFSTAGLNEFINAGTVGRLVGDALNTMQTPLLFTASSTAYNPAGDPGGPIGRRWGEYSYTSLDPSDDMTMWTIQEFSDATDSYGVRIARLLAPPPATLAGPTPIVNKGRSTYYLPISGTQVNGSGFYDPGAAPPAGPAFNHITATVTGGVVVNSVRYISPTQVLLNLNTVGATQGLQTLTITNPDGQSVNSFMIFITPTVVTLTTLSAVAADSPLPWVFALGALDALLIGLMLIRRRR